MSEQHTTPEPGPLAIATRLATEWYDVRFTGNHASETIVNRLRDHIAAGLAELLFQLLSIGNVTIDSDSQDIIAVNADAAGGIFMDIFFSVRPGPAAKAS